MTVLVWGLGGVSTLVAILAMYYVARSFAADLVLLGGAALLVLVWVLLAAVSGVRSFGGVGPTDAVTWWGYVFTGIMLPVASGYMAVIERSKWGSLAVGVVALTSIVLVLRLPQIWPGVLA